MTVILLPLLTFMIFLPSLFRYEVVKCVLYADGSITYYKRDNAEFLGTIFYSVRNAFKYLWISLRPTPFHGRWEVLSNDKSFSGWWAASTKCPSSSSHCLLPPPQVYKVILEIVFKLAPTLLIASLNIRIMIVYRKTCNKRRRMTLSHTKDDDSRKFAEERRLMFLLGTHESFILFTFVVDLVLRHPFFFYSEEIGKG